VSIGRSSRNFPQAVLHLTVDELSAQEKVADLVADLVSDTIDLVEIWALLS